MGEGGKEERKKGERKGREGRETLVEGILKKKKNKIASCF